MSEEECKEDNSGSCVASGSHPHEHQCMATIVVHLVSVNFFFYCMNIDMYIVQLLLVRSSLTYISCPGSHHFLVE